LLHSQGICHTPLQEAHDCRRRGMLRATIVFSNDGSRTLGGRIMPYCA
jgi:hypothetical protein